MQLMNSKTFGFFEKSAFKNLHLKHIKKKGIYPFLVFSSMESSFKMSILIASSITNPLFFLTLTLLFSDVFWPLFQKRIFNWPLFFSLDVSVSPLENTCLLNLTYTALRRIYKYFKKWKNTRLKLGGVSSVDEAPTSLQVVVLVPNSA